MDDSVKKVSFIKQMNADGQEGLQMLIEDMNTQNIRTITYVLEDVIEDKNDSRNIFSQSELNKQSLVANAPTFVRPEDSKNRY